MVVQRPPADQDQCEVRAVHPETVQQARRGLVADRVYDQLAATFSALSDPSRAKIISSLIGRELCVCDLAAVVGASESAVSQHLRILRNLRWVRNRKQGRMVYYSLDDAHVKALIELGLAHAAGS
ncbi:MAG: metalloregulator ArsR/SmtB family transcription factor [Dehalococcoidia bacterium]